MYGHANAVKRQARHYKPVGKRGRPTLLSRFEKKQTDLFEADRISTAYGLSEETRALMNRVHCLGCE